MSYGAPYGYGSGYGYGVTGGYNPFADTSLALWLEAGFGLLQERTGASATTPASADGDPVGTWRDRRGVIQATANLDASRPVYRPVGVNSRKSVEFDGADDRCLLSGGGSLGILRARSYVACIAAIRATASTSRGVVFTASMAASDNVRFALTTNGGGQAGALQISARVVDSGGDSQALATAAFADDEVFVVTAIADYGGGDLYLRKNGVLITTGANLFTPGTTPDTDSLRVGVGYSTNGTMFFDGLISGLMVCVPASGLTAAELLARERYLGVRAGVSF